MATQPPEQLKDARTTFSAWGGGAYTCLGQHMAMMELRLAAAFFFQRCRGAELGPTADADMDPVNYFVIRPSGKKCEVIMKDTKDLWDRRDSANEA